jgi:hypothetical protein
MALGVMAVAFSFSACGGDDPFRPAATRESAVREVSLASFSTGTVAPTALDLLGQRIVRPELLGNGAANFQLTFDVEPNDEISLIPALAVLSPPNGGTSLGLQRSTASFEESRRAPLGGFAFDSTVTTGVRETWFFQLNAGVCSFGEPFYGKVEIDGINSNTKRLIVRYLINLNCGYRDLTEGLPRN